MPTGLGTGAVGVREKSRFPFVCLRRVRGVPGSLFAQPGFL